MVAALVFDLINHRSGAAHVRLELQAGRTTEISPNLINANCPISSKLCTYYCSTNQNFICKWADRCPNCKNYLRCLESVMGFSRYPPRSRLGSIHYGTSAANACKRLRAILRAWTWAAERREIYGGTVLIYRGRRGSALWACTAAHGSGHRGQNNS